MSREPATPSKQIALKGRRKIAKIVGLTWERGHPVRIERAARTPASPCTASLLPATAFCLLPTASPHTPTHPSSPQTYSREFAFAAVVFLRTKGVNHCQ